MGAKDVVAQRLRRGIFKCEFCGRSLMSLESLRSHQKVLHASSLREKEKRKIAKARGAQKPGKIVNDKPNILKNMKSVEKNVVKKPETKIVEQTENNTDAGDEQVKKKKKVGFKVTDANRVEFKCPKCEKNYPVYFSALKHIQKYHCVNAQGLKVQPDSPELIMPIRVEICIHCQNSIADNEKHVCRSPNEEMSVAFSYCCSACMQTFTNVTLFNLHVAGIHNEGAEHMFFPTREEFNTWKDEMEKKSNTKYLIMGKYNFKQIYHCACCPVTEDETRNLCCPSTIVYQEFSKGIQVHLYKQHSGHEYKEYELPEQFKKYCITGLLQQAAGYTDLTALNSDDGDLYMQFKTLMESIVLDAAKINIETLKILIGKALDMTSVLTSYNDEDDSDSADSKSRLSLSVDQVKTDENLSKALQVLRSSQRLKRTVDTSIEVTPAKKVKPDSPILQKVISKPLKNANTVTPVNKFTLATDKDSDKILKELNESSKPEGIENKVVIASPRIMPKLDQSPSSFNDSYKDFVHNSYITAKPKPIVRKTVMKTKIGQFKPSPPKPIPPKSTPSKTTLSKSTPTKVSKPTSSKPTPSKPTPSKTGVKNGPSIKPQRRESRGSIGVKEVEYEVKERENDCNILILKI